MPSNVLTTGDTAEDSGDIELAVGAAANLCLKDAAANASVGIYRKDDAGAYHLVGDLTESDPDRLLLGPATYRVSRIAGVSCGVFRD